MKKSILALLIFGTGFLKLHAQIYRDQLTGPTPVPSSVEFQYPNTGIGVNTAGGPAPVSAFNIEDGSAFSRSTLDIFYRRTTYGLLVEHGAYPRGTIDLAVGNGGLTGIGVVSPTAHLDLTDQNGDGLALMQITPYTMSGPQILIDQYANIGIGTLSPAAALDIETGINPSFILNDGTQGSGYILSCDIDGQATWVDPATLGLGSGFWTASGPNIYNTNTGNIGIGTSTPQSLLDVNGSISVGLYAGTYAAPNSGIIVSGSIGIGTPIPAYPLDVAGDANISNTVHTANFQMTAGAAVGNVLQSDATGNANWVDPAYLFNSHWTVSGSSIHNSNGGYVGIGTSSPSANLEVASNGCSSAGGLLLTFTGDNATPCMAPYGTTPSTYSPNSTMLSTRALVSGSYVSGMNIQSDGHMSIGNGYIGTALLGIKSNGSLTTPLSVQDASGAQNLIVTGAGMVGIGTTTPAYNLDITGNTHISANEYVDGMIGLGTTSPLATIDVQGTVRIGNVPVSSGSAPTLATDYSLYVEKGVIAEKFKVALSSDATNWSDYVFDKNYKLASLSEVQKYISENKHLPDVPSAYDVCEQGIDMADMDATLLRKIEELTLYILQLKKDNEVIKAQLLNNIK